MGVAHAAISHRNVQYDDRYQLLSSDFDGYCSAAKLSRMYVCAVIVERSLSKVQCDFRKKDTHDTSSRREQSYDDTVCHHSGLTHMRTVYRYSALRMMFCTVTQLICMCYALVLRSDVGTVYRYSAYTHVLCILTQL